MSDTTWTKKSLCETVNQRVDRGEMGGTGYIMPMEVTDQALETFQIMWDKYAMNPLAREEELRRFYQSIVAGW